MNFAGRDELLQLHGGSVKPVGVPGQHRVNRPGFDRRKKRPIAGPRLAAERRQIVVDEHLDNLEADFGGKMTAVLFLPVDPQTGTDTVARNPHIDDGAHLTSLGLLQIL